jgi:hypothetical protein
MQMREIKGLNTGSFNNNKKNSGNIKYLLCLALGFLFTINVLANPNKLTARYNMYLLSVSIGEFSVTQTSENGNVIIEAITDVNINLLFSYRIQYIQNAVYNQGILQSSHIATYKNGKLNSNMWLKLQNNSYLLVTDNDTTIINDSITFSGSLIYFNEPVGVKNIYKERSAEMRQLTSVSNHTYIIRDKKDREINRYYYEDGILQYAEMRHALGTIELNRITTDETND